MGATEQATGVQGLRSFYLGLKKNAAVLFVKKLACV